MSKILDIQELKQSGDYEHRGNLLVRSDVWVKGRLIVNGDLNVLGDIKVAQNIEVKGSLICRGNIHCEQGLEVGKHLDCDGSIKAFDWIETKKYLRVAHDVETGGWIYAGEYIDVGNTIAAKGAVFVPGMVLKARAIDCITLHFKKNFKSVRRYWAKKKPFLPLKEFLTDENHCYPEIRAEILKHYQLNELLEDFEWHPLEKVAIQLFFREEDDNDED